MTVLATSYAASGNSKAAKSILRTLEAASRSRYISSFEVAAVLASLNENDEALEFLQKAYDEHNYWLPYLKGDCRFDRLHSDPRYAELVRRIGLPQ